LDHVEPALRLSGADAIMIGRGAQGRPWWPGAVAAFAGTGVAAPEPTKAAQLDLLCAHYEALLGHFGVEVGVRVSRKHLGWYLDRLSPGGAPSALRARLLRAENPAEVRNLIADLAESSAESLAA